MRCTTAKSGAACRREPATSRRHGFTYAEMMVSVSILAVLCVALGSVMVVGGRAMSMSVSGPGAQTTIAASVASRIVSDLQMATYFSEKTSTAVTFTVPDRNGDNAADTIRYAWGGTPGQSIMYQFNSGSAVAIADNIQKVDFSYLTRTVGNAAATGDGSGGGTTPPVESGEQLLASHSLIVTGSTTTLRSTNWPAQYFKASGLPANALAWKITKVRIQLQRASTNASGTVTVQIRSANPSKTPTATILGSGSIDIASVPTTKTWVDVPLTTPAAALDPAQAVSLVIHTTANNPGSAGIDNLSADLTMAYTTTTNTGGSWATATSTKALAFDAYGTVTAPAQ